MVFFKLLKSLKAHPLLAVSISKSEYTVLDLSVYNSELENINVSLLEDLERFIWGYMKNSNAKVAYGGYLEQRGIYKRSTHFNQQNLEEERNIHLGLDLWIEASTPIFAPLDGVIHSFKNNTNYGDYGPTLILKHQINTGTFYTLYGHLSLESIADKSIGVEVKRGELIGKLGTSEVNGDYPPHLHFQIIKDIQGYSGDYPGVCSQLDLEFYEENCPDPKLLLNLK